MPVLQSPTSRSSRLQTALEVALILAVFFVQGAAAAPDVNEPQYLGKAKHYWNPDWCPNDFFLETADAHLVFYWTFGWLSLWLPLPALAWAGRLLTWALLAWAWRRLSWSLAPQAWYAPLSAALWGLLTQHAHMAGEWVIGGVEAKGFAYVLVLLGLEAVARGRWNRAWLLLGGASAFHVLVGGWSVVAAGIAWLASRENRPTLKSMAPALAGGLLLALLGLVPALVLTVGTPAETVRQANAIYVFERLPHHLVPEKIKEGFVGRHVLLACLWLTACTLTPASTRHFRFRWMIGGAIGIAVAGYTIAAAFDLLAWRQSWLSPERQADFSAFLRSAEAGILRYYWFRLSDVFVPLGVALTLLPFARAAGRVNPLAQRLWIGAAMVAVALHLGGRFVNGPLAGPPLPDKGVAYQDWLDVCRWATENTSPDAVFLTPRPASTFKWYAGRSEVVSWKDVPQDAAGIVEWWRRIGRVHERERTPARVRWWESLSEGGEPRLRALAAEFGADYAIASRLPSAPPLPWPPVYENASYAVYRLEPTAAPASGS